MKIIKYLIISCCMALAFFFIIPSAFSYFRSSTWIDTKTLLQTNYSYTAVKTNYRNTLAISKNHDLYSWGVNYSGQLGNGTTNDILSPSKINSLSNVVYVSTGLENALVLTENGNVYGFGKNEDYVLGLNHSNVVTTPTLININGLKPNEKVIYVNCRIDSRSFFLTNLGNVFSCGSNIHYKAAQPDRFAVYTKPAKVNTSAVGTDKIVNIVLGEDQTFFLTVGGNVYFVGYNTDYAIGVPGASPSTSYSTLTKHTKLNEFVNNEKIVSVKSDVNSTAYLTISGRLVVCGSNDGYQLGVNTYSPVTTLTFATLPSLGPNEKIIEVDIIVYNMAVLTNKYNIYMAGDRSYGQTGDGVSYDPHIVLTKLNGINYLNKEVPVQISLGVLYTMISTSKDRIVVFGNNEDGQLGLGYVSVCEDVPKYISL
ncbi:MAG: hypothetical protein LBV51_05115 [Acholeplasmatales bacterium]|nr:hypothetical protein [Acholeplasmatales bacterium]